MTEGMLQHHDSWACLRFLAAAEAAPHAVPSFVPPHASAPPPPVEHAPVQSDLLEAKVTAVVASGSASKPVSFL